MKMTVGRPPYRANYFSLRIRRDYALRFNGSYFRRPVVRGAWGGGATALSKKRSNATGNAYTVREFVLNARAEN